MTIEREVFRVQKRYVDDSIKSLNFAVEGVITDFSEKDKKVKVKLIKENVEVWCRISFPFFDKESDFYKMPITGARCIVLLLDTSENRYENPVVISFIQDDKNNHSFKNSDGSNDYNYMSLNNHNGETKLDLYKSNDNKKVAQLKAIDKVNIESNNVSLGESNLTSDDDSIVKKPHLDKFNNLIDQLDSLLDTLILQPTLGDLATPTPLSVRNLALGTKYLAWKASLETFKDNINKTSKTKAK